MIKKIMDKRRRRTTFPTKTSREEKDFVRFKLELL